MSFNAFAAANKYWRTRLTGTPQFTGEVSMAATCISSPTMRSMTEWSNLAVHSCRKKSGLQQCLIQCRYARHVAPASSNHPQEFPNADQPTHVLPQISTSRSKGSDLRGATLQFILCLLQYDSASGGQEQSDSFWQAYSTNRFSSLETNFRRVAAMNDVEVPAFFQVSILCSTACLKERAFVSNPSRTSAGTRSHTSPK